MAISHRIRCDSIGRTRNQADKNLALWRGQLASKLDNTIQRAVRELCEIVRLPIVSCAGREQRIESLLPLNIGLRTDMLAVSCAEIAQWSDEPLGFRDWTGVKNRQYHDLLAVNVFRKKRQRRGLAQHRPDVELVRRRVYELTVLSQNLVRLTEGKNHQAGKNLRTDRKKFEFKLRHHAEIAASATDRPKEISVLGCARPYFLTVHRSQVGGDEIVDGHAIRASKPAKAATERQSGDTCGRINSHRCRETMRHGRLIEIRERRSRLHEGTPFSGIDADALHLRKIDGEAGIAKRAAGDIVSPAANRKLEFVPARETDCRRYIISIGALHDNRGPPINHSVPYLAGFLVTGLIGNYHVHFNKCSELFLQSRHLRRHNSRLLHKLAPDETLSSA